MKHSLILTSFFFLYVLVFSIPSSATTYYLTTAGAGAAETAGNWNTGGALGGGTSASNFTTAGDIFIIDSATAATFGANTTFGSAANAVILQVDGSLTVNSSCVLTIGVSAANSIIVFSSAHSTQCSGAGSFTIASGSTLKTRNVNGIKGTNCSIASGMAGTLNIAASYEFNGSGNRLTIGLPNSVKNLTINNGTDTVTLSANVTVSGILTIASGSILNFGTTARTVNLTGTGTNTLNSSGTIDMSGGNAAHELWIYATSIANFGTLINGTTATANTVRYLGSNYIVNATPIYNILRIDGSGTATASGDITIAANGKLWIYGVTFDLGTNAANCLTGGSATFLIQGNLTVGGANNFPANYTAYTFNGPRTITYNMNGNQSIFTKAGFAYDCWLVFSGSGIKQVTGPAPLAFTAGGGYTITVNQGVTLDLNGIDGNTVSTLLGSGTIDNLNSSSTGTYLLNIRTAGTHGTFSGAIKNTYGSVAINKLGIYTETLSGLNTYTGTTTISAGIIKLGVSSSSATSGPLGAVNGGIIVTSPGELDLNGYSLIGGASKTMNLAGNTGQSGYGALTNSGTSAATFEGSITLTGAATISAQGGAINIAKPGSITGNGFNLSLRGSAGGSITGDITTGSGNVIVGVGEATVWTLSGNNTYSGTTTFPSGYASRLNINNGGTSASNSAISTGTFIITNNTSLDNTSGSSVTLLSNNLQTWNCNTGFKFIGTNNLNLGTGTVSMIANCTVTIDSNTLTVGGAISGSGYSLTKAGEGALVLSGANTYSGGTILKAGTLTFAAANVLPSAGAVTFNGGTLSSGTTIGYSQSGGALNISSGYSTLALGTGIHAVAFSAPGLISGFLVIKGWQGAYNGTGGTAGKIFVGSGLTLSAAQLSQIIFYDGITYYPAMQLSTGEVVAYGMTTVVDGLFNGNDFSIFPNPLITSSVIQFSNELKNAELVIYDVLGKEMMIKRFTGNKIEIERGSLVSGIYLLTLRDSGKQYIKKIVVE